VFRLRTISTKSGATAIQVVKYINRQTEVVKHIGSAHESKQIAQLRQAAYRWINQASGQLAIFSDTNSPESVSDVLLVNQSELISTHSVFIYEVLDRLCHRLGFDNLPVIQGELRLLLDLVIMRLISPGSKSDALRRLTEQFGIHHQETHLYRQLPGWEKLQPEVEKLLVKLAQLHFDFDFSLVFYDVTTLYFETDKTDQELKICGFSKDHKFNQPQIVVGLMVTGQGLPVGWGVFPGNKFEGHTLMPMIECFKKRYGVKKLTVVADAAMISQDNVDLLIKHQLHYIVGARLGNLGLPLIKKINQRLAGKDGATIRLVTSKGRLVGAFSQDRYSKDQHETEKQIDRAKQAIANPGKRKHLKFLIQAKNQPQVNQKLIDKAAMLWGIKGYYTNLTQLTNQEIIDQYHNLWQVEKSFRITKSDLQARPIYHHKAQAIRSHILICVMALALGKYLEIKTNLSLKKCTDLLKSIKDAKICNQDNQTITLRSKISPDVNNLLQKLNLSH